MVCIVLIEKTGVVKESKINNFNIDQLFRKCKHSNNNNFSKRNTWQTDIYITLFAKNSEDSDPTNPHEPVIKTIAIDLNTFFCYQI